LDELRPGEAQHVLLLLALGFRHDDDRLETHRGADKREADAGVPCRPLDNRAAGLQRTPRHSVANDPESGAVLHGLARVHELGFA
jgi:hypothetical protein